MYHIFGDSPIHHIIIIIFYIGTEFRENLPIVQ